MHSIMRTLKELVEKSARKVAECEANHRYCVNALQAKRIECTRQLMPVENQFYIRRGERSVPIHVLQVRIKELVTNTFKRYVLSEEMRPPVATLFILQEGPYFHVKYASKTDQIALPPFHIGIGEGWLSVCLGVEKCPTPESLGKMLETVNLADSFMNLMSMTEVLGLLTIPAPFDAWSKAMPSLALGHEQEGFTLITEMRI